MKTNELYQYWLSRGLPIIQHEKFSVGKHVKYSDNETVMSKFRGAYAGVILNVQEYPSDELSIATQRENEVYFAGKNDLIIVGVEVSEVN